MGGQDAAGPLRASHALRRLDHVWHHLPAELMQPLRKGIGMPLMLARAVQIAAFRGDMEVRWSSTAGYVIHPRHPQFWPQVI